MNKNEQSSKFIFLEHTADVKFQAYGKSLEECFKNSALAMFNTMYSEKVKATEKEIIKAEAKDIEGLLYQFLEQLLILFDSKGFFLSKVESIKIVEEKEDKNKKKGKKFILNADVLGSSVEKERYAIHVDIKAITYNEMFVKHDNKNKKWISQVVVDV